jgi:glycerol-3-phosphate dehydrogenase
VPEVSAASLEGFLEDLRAALPALEINADRVLRVYRGFLPGRRKDSAELSLRPSIVDHAAFGGPDGLWSVSGVMFTTARRVAALVLRRASGRVSSGPLPEERLDLAARRERFRFGPDWRPSSDPTGCSILRAMIADESVQHLDDLLFRRTALGDDPRTARALSTSLACWFSESSVVREEEERRVSRALEGARASLT